MSLKLDKAHRRGGIIGIERIDTAKPTVEVSVHTIY